MKPEDFREPYPGRMVEFMDSRGKQALSFIADELPVTIPHDVDVTSAAVSGPKAAEQSG